MKKITILQNGGGWITNIGNAFIDIGSMVCLREAANKAGIKADIHLISVSGRWIFYHMSRGIKGYILKRPGKTKNVLNLQEYVKADYVVQWGAFLSKHWFRVHGEILLKLSKKGIKLIINGGGIGEKAYSEEEIAETRKYLKKIKPYALISRDKETFENFKDLAEHSYNGIDCAFWVNDAYIPLKLDLPEYVVLNFDKQPEPRLDELNIGGNKLIIRTHHAVWYNFPISQWLRMKKNYYDRENTMISEVPYDYLNLYANAVATYSDRVHACVVTLAYGKPARLFGNPSRALLFERVGASKITRQLVKPNVGKIEKEKQKQIDFLSEIL